MYYLYILSVCCARPPVAAGIKKYDTAQENGDNNFISHNSYENRCHIIYIYF